MLGLVHFLGFDTSLQKWINPYLTKKMDLRIYPELKNNDFWNKETKIEYFLNILEDDEIFCGTESIKEEEALKNPP